MAATGTGGGRVAEHSVVGVVAAVAVTGVVAGDGGGVCFAVGPARCSSPDDLGSSDPLWNRGH